MSQTNKSYRGNSNLKSQNTKTEFTADQFLEWEKCSKDPIYFIEKYMKIINVDVGLTNFNLYPYQKTIINNIHEHRFNILMTCRQAGKSVSTCGYILWYIIFNSEKTVALLANKADTAREILSKVEFAYQYLPAWLQHGVIKWNEGSFVLDNNSRVLAGSTSKDSIRGYAINLLFLDEAAFIDNWDEFYTSVLPTITSGNTTKIVMVSTPNGLNHFYKTWSGAEKKENGYHYLKVTWRDVPGRDEAWKKTILAAMNNDLEKFAQEQEAEFLGSSSTLIAGWKLKELFHNDPILAQEGLRQFEKPIKDHHYVISADVSHGKSLDYSAFHVIDVSEMPFKQVCTYRSNTVNPTDYAGIIFGAAKIYNEAMLLVENNDMGVLVNDIIYNEYEYENMFYTQGDGNQGRKVSTGFNAKQKELGIRTTKNVKSAGCSLFKLLVEQNQLIINDEQTQDEIKTFSKKLNSYEAEPGNNDDLVMGLVLFSWLSGQKYFREMTENNTIWNLKELKDEQMEKVKPAPIIVEDHNESNEKKPVMSMDQFHRWLLD